MSLKESIDLHEQGTCAFLCIENVANVALNCCLNCFIVHRNVLKDSFRMTKENRQKLYDYKTQMMLFIEFDHNTLK